MKDTWKEINQTLAKAYKKIKVEQMGEKLKPKYLVGLAIQSDRPIPDEVVQFIRDEEMRIYRQLNNL